MLLAEPARAERLEQIIKAMQRHRFGRRAESLPEDQLLLGLEEAEQVEYCATIWIGGRGDQDGGWLSRRDDDCRAATEMQALS